MSRPDNDQIRSVLEKVPFALRTLAEENVKLASQLAAYQRKDLAEDIILSMEAKGISDPTVPKKQKIAALLSSDKDLAVVKEAMSLVTPDMSFASVSDIDLPSEDSLVDYLLT